MASTAPAFPVSTCAWPLAALHHRASKNRRVNASQTPSYHCLLPFQVRQVMIKTYMTITPEQTVQVGGVRMKFQREPFHGIEPLECGYFRRPRWISSSESNSGERGRPDRSVWRPAKHLPASVLCERDRARRHASEEKSMQGNRARSGVRDAPLSSALRYVRGSFFVAAGSHSLHGFSAKLRLF